MANSISLEGNLDSLNKVSSSKRSLFTNPFFTLKSSSFSSAYLNSILVICEGSSFDSTKPKGPVISSDNALLLDLSAANFARVFLAILNLAEELFKALRRPLSSLTEVPL